MTCKFFYNAIKIIFGGKETSSVEHRVYQTIFDQVSTGEINLSQMPLKIALVDSNFKYIPWAKFWDGKHECSSRGYPMGGISLETEPYNDLVPHGPIEQSLYARYNSVGFFGSIVARGAVIYIDEEQSRIVSHMDFGQVEKTCCGCFSIEWNNKKILKFYNQSWRLRNMGTE